jgi:hypothetical protein
METCGNGSSRGDGNCGGNGNAPVQRAAGGSGRRRAEQWPLALRNVGPLVSDAVVVLDTEVDGGCVVRETGSAPAVKKVAEALVSVVGPVQEEEVMEMSVEDARREMRKCLASLEDLAMLFECGGAK